MRSVVTVMDILFIVGIISCFKDASYRVRVNYIWLLLTVLANIVLMWV